jgi:hypothetical protein
VVSYMVLGQMMPLCSAGTMLTALGCWHLLVAGAMVTIINRLCHVEPTIRWHGERFPTKVYTRGCHWIPYMFA